MVILEKDTARDLPVFLYDSTDHVTPKTGVAEGSVTVKTSKDLGALTAFTLTGKWIEIGQGLYEIAFASGDLDTVGFFGYLVTATGCDQYSGMMYVSVWQTNGALEATLTTIKGAGWTNETLKAIKEAIGSGGIDAQAVRDAMKLAPSAGAPVAESIDKHLDDLVSGAEPPPKESFKI